MNELSEISSPEVRFKSAYEHDVEASLICNYIDNSYWDVFLTHISGIKVEFLFGKSFLINERLPLVRLLLR